MTGGRGGGDGEGTSIMVHRSGDTFADVAFSNSSVPKFDDNMCGGGGEDGWVGETGGGALTW